MFKHYLLTIFRILSRNKLNLFLNLTGLTLGLAAAFIVLNYVLIETGFDRFHKNKKRIYRILTEKPDVNWTEPKTSYILTEYMTDHIPEVEKVTSIGYLPYAQVKKGEEFGQAGIFRTATSDIFEIFTFKFTEGNPAEALKDPFSVAISKDIAEKYFPGESALGKTIEINSRDNLYTLTVTVVFDNIPKLSSLKADFIGNIELSFREYEREEWSKDIRTAWHLDFFRSFVLLKTGTDPEIVEEKFRYIESEFMGDRVNFVHYLQKLTDMYLHSSHLVNAGLRGNLTNLYIFSAIGFVILIIYFICSILLESFVQPLAIIGMIPVSFIGVFLTFYLFDFNFDQGGFASFILLSGIVVNSGLYIINDYNNFRRTVDSRGDLESPREYHSRHLQGNLRLYLKAFNHKIIPIFLTVSSTILGLVPFVWAGQNEVFWFAFAAGAMGGLVFSFIAVIGYLPLFLKLKQVN